mmetsp:Transcript_2479/g.3748  ORF Transcript_2479/g.3748 Transcript_2479/m.3748 type:complete len:267 (+) Transcript_2479:200-1000(+)
MDDICLGKIIGPKCPNLLHLDISGNLTANALKLIATNLPRLAYLRVEGDFNITIPKSRSSSSNHDINEGGASILADSGFESLGALKELRELRLIFHANFVTEQGILTTLKKLHLLRKLELPFSSCLTDEGAKQLGDCCPDLELVDLYACKQLSNTGLVQMANNLPHLRCLNVKRCTRLSKPGAFDVLDHGSIQHIQLPNFAGLLSADVMLRVEQAGFTHEGAGRLFARSIQIHRWGRGKAWARAKTLHPTSGLFLRCCTCRGVGPC